MPSLAIAWNVPTIHRDGKYVTSQHLAARLKKELLDTMLQSAELFKIKPFFLSDEFSVVDATIAPMIWRMRRYEIELPPQAQAMAKYAATIMARPSMRASLSDLELEMGIA